MKVEEKEEPPMSAEPVKIQITSSPFLRVDDNVPPPRSYNSKGFSAMLPLSQMAVGQSFFVPEEMARRYKSSLRKLLMMAIYPVKRAEAKKFQIADTVEDGKAGCRVWRTE